VNAPIYPGLTSSLNFKNLTCTFLRSLNNPSYCLASPAEWFASLMAATQERTVTGGEGKAEVRRSWEGRKEAVYCLRRSEAEEGV
jgi:hypothetical protein